MPGRSQFVLSQKQRLDRRWNSRRQARADRATYGHRGSPAAPTGSPEAAPRSLGATDATYQRDAHGPRPQRRRGTHASPQQSVNYWPGFVDALSTLVLSIVFLLSVFLVVQFFLSQEVTGKDKALEQLNAKLAQLNDLLSLEKLAGPQPQRPALAGARRAGLGGSRARPHQGTL